MKAEKRSVGRISEKMEDGTSFMITRIVSCFALPQSFPLFAYRGINIPLLCSYRGVSQGHSPTLVQAQVGSDLLTL